MPLCLCQECIKIQDEEIRDLRAQLAPCQVMENDSNSVCLYSVHPHYHGDAVNGSHAGTFVCASNVY